MTSSPELSPAGFLFSTGSAKSTGRKPRCCSSRFSGSHSACCSCDTHTNTQPGSDRPGQSGTHLVPTAALPGTACRSTGRQTSHFPPGAACPLWTPTTSTQLKTLVLWRARASENWAPLPPQFSVTKRSVTWLTCNIPSVPWNRTAFLNENRGNAGGKGSVGLSAPFRTLRIKEPNQSGLRRNLWKALQQDKNNKNPL